MRRDAHDLWRKSSPSSNVFPTAPGRSCLSKPWPEKRGVAGDSIWAQVPKAVTSRRQSLSSSELPGLGQITKAEKGLIWWLIHRPEAAVEALGTLNSGDLEGLATRSVLDLALKLNDD